MSRTILTIIDDSLVAVKHGVVVSEIHTYTDFLRAESSGSVFCSSTLDFPEESTSNRAVIALCREITRGGLPNLSDVDIPDFIDFIDPRVVVDPNEP